MKELNIKKIIDSYNCLVKEYKKLHDKIAKIQMGTSNHNSLYGLQGGMVGEYYHLTKQELDKLVGLPLDSPSRNDVLKLITEKVKEISDNIDEQIKRLKESISLEYLQKGTYIGTASNLKNEIDNKVNLEIGKGLSQENFTTELKNKLESLNNVNTSIFATKTGLDTLQNALDEFKESIKETLKSNNTDLDTLQEIVNFIKENRRLLNNLSISSISGLQTALDGKSDVNHNHNNLYYSKTEVDTKLANLNPTHNHDDRYYTKSQVDTSLNNKADKNHNHNDLYYTKQDTDNYLNAKANLNHTHHWDTITGKHTFGDMTKAVYDTNNNGSVDKADSINIIKVDITTSANVENKTGITENGSYVPKVGDELLLVFQNGNTASNVTLNIDGTGVKPIKLSGKNVTWETLNTGTATNESKIARVWYDGNNYQMYGSLANHTYDIIPDNVLLNENNTNGYVISGQRLSKIRDWNNLLNIPEGLKSITEPTLEINSGGLIVLQRDVQGRVIVVTTSNNSVIFNVQDLPKGTVFSVVKANTSTYKISFIGKNVYSGGTSEITGGPSSTASIVILDNDMMICNVNNK